MRRYVLRRQLRQLVRLRVHPAERLQVFEVLVLRQLDGQVDRLVRSPLRRHHDAANLLHLRIVRRTDAVQVAGDLGAQVRNGHKLLQHVLGQNVRVARLLDVVRRHVDVVGAQVEVGGRNGPDAPLRLGAERLRLVVGRRARDDFVAVFVDRPRRRRSQLRLLFRLLLDLGDLLTLGGRRADLHAEDNVSNFRLGQRGHVDVVLLAVVGQDEVLELHFHLDPLLVRQRRPDVMRLGDGGLVRLQHHLGPVIVDVQGTQNEDET